MAQKRQKRNSGNICIVNESISIFLFLFSNISSEISIENAMALVTKTVVVGNRHLKRQKRNSGNICIVNESISIFLFLFSNISSEISIENAMALVTKTVVVGNRHLGETKI